MLSGMIRAVNGDGDDGCSDVFIALIVDSSTLELVSNVLRPEDLTENRIAVIDKIERTREPLPTMDAVYYLEPTMNNFKLILQDFPDLSQFKPKYRRHHIFVNHTVSEDAMKVLTQRKDAVKRIRTFVELNMDFVARDDRTFHLRQSPLSMFRVFPRRNAGLVREYAFKLLSFFATLQDYPVIRYQNSSVDRWCEHLAHSLQGQLDRYWTASDKYPNTAPCTLLIVDRSLDCAVPFLHDFTYEGAAVDLVGCYGESNKRPLDLKTEKFTYSFTANNGKSGRKTVQLGDKLWENLKHRSILAVRDQVMSDVKKLGSENSELVKFAAGEGDDGGAAVTTEETARMIRQLPEYQESMQLYNTHMQLCMDCFTISKSQELNRVGSLEQEIACAIDRDGQPVNAQPLMIALAQTLMHKNLSEETKLRMLLLYVMNMDGVTRVHRDKMSRTCNFNATTRQLYEEFMAIRLCPSLDTAEGVSSVHTSKTSLEEQYYYKEKVKAVTTLGEKESSANKTKSEKDKGRADAVGGSSSSGLSNVKRFENDLCRYEPKIKFVLEKMFAGRLSEESFPYMGEKRECAVTLGKKQGVKPRTVVFFIGGLSYTEARVVGQLCKRWNVEAFAGGDGLFSPGLLFDEDLHQEMRKERAESIRKNSLPERKSVDRDSPVDGDGYSKRTRRREQV